MRKNKIKAFLACVVILLVSSAWTYRWELFRLFLDGDGLYITPRMQSIGVCEPDTEIEVSFRMTNLIAEKISVIGLRSSCGCISGKRLPFSIDPHKTVDLDLYIVLPNDDLIIYDQVAMFIVDEEKKMKQYPVRIIAEIAPRKGKNEPEPKSEP